MLWWLAQNAVVAALVTGVVALLCWRIRFRPAVRHALWLVVLIKLMTPSLVQWPWVPFDPWPAPTAAPVREQRAAIEPVPVAIEDEEIPLTVDDLLLQFQQVHGMADADAAMIVEPPPAHPVAPERVEETPPVPARAAGFQLPDWLQPVLVSGWLAGTLVVAAVQGLRIARFRRRLANAAAAPAWLTGQVAELADRLGVRPPRVTVVPGIGSPQVWSLGRPLLLWPEALLDGLAPDRRRAVLVHELAHLRRRDHWVSWLLLLAGCVWWWNPLYWYVRRQLSRDAELACDAWVVWMLPEARRAYAEALLEVTEFVSRSAAPQPALGMSGRRQDFERRLIMIMRERVPCQVPLLGVLIIGLLTLVLLPGWSLGQRGETEKKEIPDRKVEKTDVEVQIIEVKDPTTGGVKAPSKAPADRDQQLQDLEKKIEGLLKEIQALRAGAPPAQGLKKTIVVPAPVPGADRRIEVVPSTAPKIEVEMKQPMAPATRVYGYTLLRANQEERVVHLSRATYKLPKEKADALAAFLKAHVKAEVLEIKQEGETLTVTTTPDAQRTIGEFIALLLVRPKDGNRPAPGTNPSN